MAAFYGRARTARYHRGFWVSNELSSVRAVMTNLCSHFFEPSNQSQTSQTTKSPSTAVTVIAGPPESRRTVSPGLKGMFDIRVCSSPAASAGAASKFRGHRHGPLATRGTITPHCHVCGGGHFGERQRGQKSIAVLDQIEAEIPGQGAEARRTVRQVEEPTDP